MERQAYLEHYRVYLDQVGLPTVIRRSACEATFRAEDLRTGANVAVQVIPMTALRSVVGEELETEAKAAREFEHLNIPALRDFGFDDGYFVYVTDYFAGTSAAEWVKTKGSMPVGVVLRVALQVVNASSAATFHGLEHPAINPHNIMIVPEQTAEGEWPLIKLINLLGVAPDLTPARDPASAEAFNFLSPEQVQSGATDFRSQLYSLGATLWFLLTGAAPVGGVATVASTTRLPAVVRHLLAQLLAIDPNERPLDPLVLQTQIQDCLGQLERRDAVASKLGLPLATEVTAPKEASPRANWWRPLALAALLIGLAAVAAIFLAGHFGRRGEIGVSVGVPDKVAARNASAPPIPTPPSVVPASEPSTGETPVLTSNADVATEEQTAAVTNSEAKEKSEEPAEVTADSSSMNQPNESSAGQPSVVAAENSGPPSAPIEASPPAEEKAVAQSAPTVESSVAPAAQTEIAVVTPRERPTVIPKQNKKPRVEKAAARETAPPPRTSERAQFLGVTPDGNLVYGSASEKVLTAPPSTREEAPRRKTTPRPSTPASIYGLPVLPALPPDE